MSEGIDSWGSTTNFTGIERPRRLLRIRGKHLEMLGLIQSMAGHVYWFLERVLESQ